MANKQVHQEFASTLRGVVAFQGAINIGAAGAVTSVEGRYFTAARTGAGLYTITLDEGWNGFIGAQFMLGAAVASDLTFQLGAVAVTASTPTVSFRVLAAAVATDPASGDKIYFTLFLKNTSVEI